MKWFDSWHASCAPAANFVLSRILRIMRPGRCSVSFARRISSGWRSALMIGAIHGRALLAPVIMPKLRANSAHHVFWFFAGFKPRPEAGFYAEAAPGPAQGALATDCQKAIFASSVNGYLITVG